MSRSPEPLSQLLEPFRRYADSGEINRQVPDPAAAAETVAGHFAGRAKEIDRTDGVTVDMGDWWFNVRPSNTEPMLRMNVEAPSQAELQRHVAEVLEPLEALVASGTPR
jgi:phosphomannomutase